MGRLAAALIRHSGAKWRHGETRMSLRSSGLLLCAGRLGHGRMDRVAMAQEIGVGVDELLERRIDVVKTDVGDEAIYAGVDAGRLLAVQVAARRQQVR